MEYLVRQQFRETVLCNSLRILHNRHININTNISQARLGLYLRELSTPFNVSSLTFNSGTQRKVSSIQSHNSQTSTKEVHIVAGVPSKQLSGIPESNNQLHFFSQCWDSASVDVINQGGCIESRPSEPPHRYKDFPLSALPLLESTKKALTDNFGVTRLTPVQLQMLAPLLGRRDVLLTSRPREGKSLIALIGLIEIITRRFLQINTLNQKASRKSLGSLPAVNRIPCPRHLLLDQTEDCGSELTNMDFECGEENSCGVLVPSLDRRLMAIVVCSTRDAVQKGAQDCSSLLRNHPLGLRVGIVCGGEDLEQEVEKLRSCDRPHLLFATLGRLTDHLWNTKLFASKLRKTEFLVLDDAFDLTSTEIQIDQIRSIRRKLSPKHQSIILSTTVNESLRRLMFRSFKTNFVFVNCLENFNVAHRFNYEKWIAGTIVDEFSEKESQKLDIREKREDGRIDNDREDHSTEVVTNAIQDKTRITVIHPNLCQVEGHRPNPSLLAGLLTERLRSNLQRERMNSIGTAVENQATNIHHNEDHSIAPPDVLQMPLMTKEPPDFAIGMMELQLSRKRSEKKIGVGSAMENQCECALGSDIIIELNSTNSQRRSEVNDIWITRTSEAALRTSACPTPPNVPLYSYIYNPLEFVPILYNLIQFVLNNGNELDQMLKREYNATLVNENIVSSGNQSSSSVHHTDRYHTMFGCIGRKLIVIFPTVRTADFYTFLFRDYLQVQLGSEDLMDPMKHKVTEDLQNMTTMRKNNHPLRRKTTFVFFSSKQSSEERRSSLRLFTRSESAIMFCTSMIHSVPSIHTHCIIHVGFGHHLEDFIKHCGLAVTYSGYSILLVNPIELKSMEDLLLLRVPLEQIPQSLLLHLTRPLSESIASRLRPSTNIDVQTSIVRDFHRTDVAKHEDPSSHKCSNKASRERTDPRIAPSLFVHPANFPIDMLGIGAPNLSLQPLHDQPLDITTSPPLWYKSPKMLAACQLMYRSLLGLYAMQSKHLKIRREVIPEVLNDYLRSAGLHSPPPVSREFAARMQMGKAPGLRFGEVHVAKLDLMTLS